MPLSGPGILKFSAKRRHDDANVQCGTKLAPYTCGGSRWKRPAWRTGASMPAPSFDPPKTSTAGARHTTGSRAPQHNYWLDVMCNFELYVVCPLIILLFATIRWLWNGRKYVLSDPMLLGTAIAAFLSAAFSRTCSRLWHAPACRHHHLLHLGLLIARLQHSGRSRPTTSHEILIFTQYFWPRPSESTRWSETERARRRVRSLTRKPNYPEGSVFAGYSAWGTSSLATVLKSCVFPVSTRQTVFTILYGLAITFANRRLWPGLFAPSNIRYRVCLHHISTPAAGLARDLACSFETRPRRTLGTRDLWPESLSATGFVLIRGARSRWPWWCASYTGTIGCSVEAFDCPSLALTLNGSADIRATRTRG
jgi:hypothetical protein